MHLRWHCNLAAAFLGLATAPALAAPYTFTQIGPTPTPLGVNLVGAEGINNAGDIVGITQDTSIGNSFQSFLYSGGVYTPITVPGANANGTIVSAINDLGQFAGSYLGPPGAINGFSYGGGSFQTVNLPGYFATFVSGLNNQGVAVGAALDPSDNFVGFTYQNGSFTLLAAPNATFTDALGINNAGDVVGSYLDADGNNHGFLLHNGQYTTIDDPNAAAGPFAGTTAVGINNLGEIVGYYIDDQNSMHGFVYQNGAFTTLDAPLGGGGTGLNGVNDLGQIVGANFDPTGTQSFGFLATPEAVSAPEPAALTLLSTAAFVAAAVRLRRRS
jgi:probable HAF family extracellular repeat protein